MHDTGRMTTRFHTSRRQDDWRRADEWRRRQTEPAASAAAVTQTRPRFGVASLLRLIPHHA